MVTEPRTWAGGLRRNSRTAAPTISSALQLRDWRPLRSSKEESFKPSVIQFFLSDRKPSSSTSSRSSPVSRTQIKDSYEYFKREKPAPKHDNSALHDSIKQANSDMMSIIINNESSVLGNSCY